MSFEMSSEMNLSLSLDALESVSSQELIKTERGTALQGLVVYLDMVREVFKDISMLRDTLLSLGASVTSELEEGITHVVFDNNQTHNCERALHLQRRPLIVSRSWVLECSRQHKYVSEAPYLIYNLNEELELAKGEATKKCAMMHDGNKKVISNQIDNGIGQLSEAFQDFHIKPIAVRTKSVALNMLQLMPTPPELIPQRKHVKRNIAVSALSRTYKQVLRETIKRLGVYEYKRKVDEHTKVLVADDEGIVTANLLKALVLGVRIVNKDWVKVSSEKGCWLHPSFNYCIKKWLPICKRYKCRGMKKLLDSSTLFFVSTGCSVPHETLTFLISHAGGKLTNVVSEANVIITRTRPCSNIIKAMSTTKSPAVVVAQWLIDSILNGAVKPFDEYELDLTQSTLGFTKLEMSS